MQKPNIHPASFRDPSGFIFESNGDLYRQINQCYKPEYEQLINTKLYKELIENELLIPHEESQEELVNAEEAYKVIKPALVPYITYPYEWSFSQLKDAALLTLEIQKLALSKGMSLKDASAYNVQFYNGKAIFIDTLSFEKYNGGPWNAYKQFCQHFLAPLALKASKDRRLGQLMRTNIDGIPLDLASKLLPRKTYLNFSLLTHIHMHAKMQEKYSDSARTDGTTDSKTNSMGLRQITAIIDQLHSFIKKLGWKQEETEWGNYYEDTNYVSDSMTHKKQLVDDFCAAIGNKSMCIIDMGANNGEFSRVASKHANLVISQDIDEVAVERNYMLCRQNKESKIVPLLQDLTNPSPAIGWDNNERMSLTERNQVDTVMALALIHHIAISNNVPLNKIAEFFSKIGEYLIIEFVPKSDSQVERLLTTREDIFPHYTQEVFEAQFGEYFKILKSSPINQSERTLYLMKSL